MRILALNWRDWTDPRAGGAEVHLRAVLTRLARGGDEITLLCTRPPGAAAAATQDGISVVRCGSDVTAAWKIPAAARRILQAAPFDVVLDDVNKIPFRAPRWSPVPVVALFHHLFGREFFREVDPFRAAVLWALERRVGRDYRGVPAVAVSAGTRDELLALGLRPVDVAVVENGLDHRVYRPGAGGRADPATVLVVSRLQPYKRVDVAVRAAALLYASDPSVRWMIAGQGPERAGLERLAVRLRAPVTFVGPVSEDEKVRLYQQAAVVVAPSAKEGFGLTLVEAAACGTPVAASDVPGHRDALSAAASERFAAGDSAACAAAVGRLLHNPAHAQRLIQSGLHRAAELDWDQTAAAIRSILATVVGSAATKITHPGQPPRARTMIGSTS